MRICLNSVQRSAGKGFGGDIGFASRDPKLIKGVSKKANSTAADRAIVAELCTVTGRMKPVFKDIVSVGTTFSTNARTHFLHVRASNASVAVGAGIATNGFFSSVGKRADSPVVNKTLCAGDDLEVGEKKMRREGR